MRRARQAIEDSGFRTKRADRSSFIADASFSPGSSENPPPASGVSRQVTTHAAPGPARRKAGRRVVALVTAKLVQSTALAGVAFAILAAAVVEPAPALAQTLGGTGGGADGDLGADSGGKGGAPGQPGGTGFGGAFSGGGGGGGGGAGGGAGGTGGSGKSPSGKGGTGGTGGAHGTAGNGWVGSPGEAGKVGGANAGGGGGGAGGFGRIVTGPSAVSNASSSTITGGKGGTGGTGGAYYYQNSGTQAGTGASGGDGGLGVQFTDTTGGSLENHGKILGGDGGHFGARGSGGSGTADGNGGNGGAAVWGGGQRITNMGTLQGGQGGAGTDNDDACCGTSGNGGNGITGDNFTIVNSGRIAGGASASTKGFNETNGNGGDGISGSGSTITNSGSIIGGAGGDNLATVLGQPVAGNGGNGISGDNLTINNTGTIAGGAGGNTPNVDYRGGSGGDGITGSNLTVINSGTILGGAIGTPSDGLNQAGNAITFTGGVNVLELRQGTDIRGDVEIHSRRDTLRLGGDGPDSFNVALTAGPARYGGFGVFEKTGTSTWTLNNTTTALTPWTIKAGTLSISSDGALGKSTGVLTLDGGTLESTVIGLTSARNVSITNNNGTFHADSGNGFIWSGVISDKGSDQGKLILEGAGALTLTGTNTYSGGTTISGGSLSLGNGGASGSIQGDVLNNDTLAFDRSDTYTFGGKISGTGKIVQSGTGTTVLSGANSYSGGTLIQGGTLSVSSNGNLGDSSGGLTFNGGTLKNTASFSSARTVTLNSGGGTFNTGGSQTGKDLTLIGVINGHGALTKDGNSKLTLTNANNTYTGGTTINEGTLSISSNGNLGDASGDLTFNGGVLENTASFSSARDVTFGNIAPGGGTFKTDAKLILSGNIAGSGELTKRGSDTLVLTGSAAHTGDTAIWDGTLQIGNGGTSGSISGYIRNYSKLTFNRSDKHIVGARIDGTGAVEQAADSTLIFTADNHYDGTTTITQGTLQLGNGGSSGSVAQGIVNQGKLVFNRSDNALKLHGKISGAGSITQAGSGTTTLSGANTYTGATNVNAGTLIIDGVQSGAGATTVASGATLGGGGTIGGDVRIMNGGTLLSEDSNADGTNTLAINGDLLVNRSGSIDYHYGLSPSGNQNALMIDVAGDAYLNGTVNISKDPSVTLDAGIYGLLKYGGTKSGDLTLNTAPAGDYSLHTDTAHKTIELINATGVDLHFWDGGNAANQDNGVVDGGNGTWQASGGNTNWTEADGSLNGPYADGSMAIFKGTAGTVEVDNSKGVVKVKGMQFAVDGYAVVDGTITLNSGDNIIRVGDGSANSASYTAHIGSKLTGAGKLIKTDAGTLVLDNSNNDYTGGTQINAGTLSIKFDDGALGSGALAFNGGTLQNTTLVSSTRAIEMLANGGTFKTDQKLTLSGVISGVGGLTKTGGNTLVLTGANKYKGGTTINAGTISVSSDGNLGDTSGALAFNGGRLENHGTTLNSARNVMLKSGGGTFRTIANLDLSGDITGRGALTKFGSATLTLTGDAGHTGGTTISHGTLQIGNGGAAGSIAGNIANDSTLVFNRTGTLTYTGKISGLGNVTQKGSGTTVFTGASNYSGGTTVSAGTLQIGNGGTKGSIIGDVFNSGTVAFDRSDKYTFSGSIEGSGKLVQKGSGTTILTGGNNIYGGTTISAGTLQIGNGGTTGSIIGNVSISSGATFAFNRSDTSTFGRAITGSGDLKQVGSGTTVLIGTNNYSGGTEITRGTLQLGNGGVSGSITGDVDSDGTLAFDRMDTYTFSGKITGTGGVTQAGSGRTVLTGTSSYSGGTQISAGILQIGNGGNSGSITGNVSNSGTLVFNRSNAYTFNGVISGSGKVVQMGSGTTTLTGTNSYKGTTQVRRGTLVVNGDQSAATGKTTVLNDGTLSGKGTLGGDVAVNSGGALVMKDDGGGISKLTVKGDLSMAGGSALDYTYGLSPSGNQDALLADVDGDLTLDGTINVATEDGVTLAPGIYGLVHYGGDLRSKNFTVGSIPAGDFEIQTAIDHRVNLINATGMNLHFWDGPNGLNDGIIEGGSGVWQAESGNHDWTNANGTVNGGFTDDSLAIFHGTAGTVTVDDSFGPIKVAGMQFATDGYVIEGGDVALGRNPATIRVGDGSAHGANYTATIKSGLTGAAKLIKSDHGTLVLTGTNSYAGGTEIDAGTLNVSKDANLGASGTKITIDGGTLQFGGSFNTGRNITLSADGVIDTQGNTNTLRGTIDGSGKLTKEGSGTLALSGTNGFSGGLMVDAGTVRAGAANQAFGSGRLTVKSGATADLAGFDETVGGLAGAGNVTLGSGTLTSTQSDNTAFSGIISGAGGLAMTGTGRLTLSGANSYTGATRVENGTLVVNGDQSSATGKTNVLNGGTLTGNGTLGSDVDIENSGTLAIKDDGSGITKLSVKGNLAIASGGNLDYTYGLAPNGNHNALMVDDVGDLTLDGTINVATEDGVTLSPGIYGLIHYHGDLKSANYTVGTIPAGDFEIQTAITGRVNLVNATGMNLHFWDPNGEDGSGTIEGGSGVWQAAAGNANWTDASGTSHGGFTDDGFAIFHGQPGTVMVDDSLGAVRVSGMQFGVNGYVVKGDGLTLGTDPATIRVGDGTAAGADFMATILSDISGDAKLVKSDPGTLVLAGNNSYAGGTEIDAGTLNVSKDVNLGAAGTKITIDGGTLQFGSAFDTARDVTIGSGNGVIDTGANTNTLSGVIDGAGKLTKEGSGTLRLTGDSTYDGPTTIAAGRLAVDGSIASAVTVTKQGILSGTGTVGDVTNKGIVAPGSDTRFGTLTVDGDYTGKKGRLSVNTHLAGDNSPTDRLHVTGGTFGDTTITVHNAGGKGAPTNQGIKLVDVDGASKGSFTLDGHYTFKGDPAVVAGAYAYRLYNVISGPNHGDWYLRSTLENQKPNPPKPQPHYQPGAPVYEAYGQALMEFNAVGTLRERLGSRIWRDNPDITTAATPLGSAPEPIATPAARGLKLGTVWGRIEAAHGSYDPRHATSSMDYDTDIWKLQAGLDGQLYETGAGDLIGGLFGQYGTVSADVASPHGDGSIDATGYGFGGTLTWFGMDGLYLDALAQATWYDSDLSSGTASRDLARDNDGFGYAFSLEAGKAFTLTPNWSFTPQAQLTYSSVDFDAFTDPFGARVAHKESESLKGRAGAAIGHHATWRDTNGQAAATHLYGIANLTYEMLDGVTAVDLAGTTFATANDRLWGGIGLGGSYSWADNKYALHGELALDASLENFADSYAITGNVGIKVRW